MTTTVYKVEMREPGKTVENTQNNQQFIRFVIVGFFNFVVSFSFFYLLYNYLNLSSFLYSILGTTGSSLESALFHFGADSLDATLANLIAYGAGILNSFIWNKFWTFKARHQIILQFGRFLALNLFCLLISSASLFLFTDFLNLPSLPIWVLTMGLVTVINFIFNKIWVFR